MEPITLIIIAGALLLTMSKKKAATQPSGTPAINPAGGGITPYAPSMPATSSKASAPIVAAPAVGYAFNPAVRASSPSGFGALPPTLDKVLGVSPQLQNPVHIAGPIQNRINNPVNAGTSVGFVKMPTAPQPMEHFTSPVSSTLTRGGRTFKSLL